MPPRQRRSRKPYLDAAKKLSPGKGSYACLVLARFAPSVRHAGIDSRSVRLFRDTFGPPMSLYTFNAHPDMVWWWNSTPWHGANAEARIWALLLAHEMHNTGDLVGQGEKHG